MSLTGVDLIRLSRPAGRRKSFATSALGRELYALCRGGEVVELGFGDREGLGSAGTGPDAALSLEVLGQVTEAIGHGRPAPGFPLDQDGTEFDHLVWSAIREIPFGQTISYSDLAERIGRPGSQRAVARACGRNAVAILVPCHRVVAADGSLGGYRWGVGLKRALLEAEARAT